MIVDVIIGLIAVALVFGVLIWKMIEEDKSKYGD